MKWVVILTSALLVGVLAASLYLGKPRGAVKAGQEPAHVSVPEQHLGRTNRLPEFRDEAARQPSQEVHQEAESLQADIEAEAARRQENIKTAADLKRYFDELEDQARQKRQVTAMEVEPALRLLARMWADLGQEEAARLQNGFVARMAALSSDLDPAVSAANSPSTNPIDQNQENRK